MDKLLRIQALENEVRDFHPVLHELFQRLPQIVSVEYRQGPREMGSDFVLEKRDETLLSSEYIGVIVKVGKIKQDHHDVERQIEECELSRTFGSGKKKIILTEVWIVSNDTISQGAQDKIHHKYKNKSIKFISGERTVELINRSYPEYWTDVSIKIGDYFRKIKASAQLLSSGTSLLGIGAPNIHIEQDLIKVAPKKFRTLSDRRQKKRMAFNSAIQEHRFIIIESGMGAGKSTLLANAVSKLADPENYLAGGKVPALTTAKEIRDKYQGNLVTLVDEVTSMLGTDIKQCVIFIDAWDELHQSIEQQLDLLTKIKNGVSKDETVSVVIASRPLPEELEAFIDREYQKFSLPPFSIKQVISLVDAICNSDTIRLRLLKDLEKSNLFKVLPKTPISAILLAKLLRENVHEIPSTMTELYGKYMELVMGRWDMSKGLQSQTEYEVIHNVSINLAKFIVDNSLDTLSVAEVKDMFDSYIDSRNLKLDKEKTFERLLTKSDLFITSPEINSLAFRHRTFAEYLYASGLDRDGNFKLEIDVFDRYWNTIYFFYFGIKRDAERLVEGISKIELSETHDRISRLIMLPNMLLAAYLTPYAAVSLAVRRYFDEAASLYLDTLKATDKDSPLLELSPLQLLCVLTELVSSAHAYEFFEPALRECAEELYSRPSLDPEKDMAELFLVNSALLTLGDKHAYDTLLDDYGPTIPFPIRVGVVGHSEEVGIQSDALERYAKKLLKNISTNPGLRASLIHISETPTRDFVTAPTKKMSK